MKGWASAAIVYCVLLDQGVAGQAGEPLAALERAEARWASHRPQGYEFTLDIRCVCLLAGHPVTFRVEGHEARLLDDVNVHVRPAYEAYNTIEKLLAIIRRTARLRTPFKVVVSYDERAGYPLQADIDPQWEAMDDELWFRVTGFKVLR